MTGQLDVIAEYAVVADLQPLNPGFLPFGGLGFADPVLAVGHDVPELVHVLAVAVLQDAALPDHKRRIVHHRLVDHPVHVVQRIEILIDGRQLAAGGNVKLREELPQLRHDPERLGNRAQIPSPCRLIRHLGDQPLKIEYPRQQIPDLLPQHEIADQGFHRLLSGQDLHRVCQGMLDPVFEHARPHRRLRFVEDPEERALFVLRQHRLTQLKIPARGKIHLEKLRRFIDVQIFDIRNVRHLGFRDVG